MDGLEFQLQIEQSIRGSEAITELERAESTFQDAKHALDEYTKEILKTNAALEKNAAKLEETRTALEGATAAGDEKQIAKYTAKLEELTKAEDKLKSSLGSAQSSMQKSATETQHLATSIGHLKDIEKRDEHSDKRAEAYTNELAKLTGRAGDAGSKLATMGNELGTVGTLTSLAVTGTLLLVAAVVAVGAAFVAGAAAVAEYAIALSGAHREQEQTLRAMTQSNEKAAMLNDSFTTIQKGTGIASDRLIDMTRALTTGREQMGLAQLSGAKLEKALYALSEQETALGDSSGTGLLIDQLNSGATSVERLGDRMDRKFGSVVEQKMLGLGHQMDTLKANIAGLFEHVNIEGILRGFSRLVALFDSSTSSGRGLQILFNDIFGPTVGDHADDFFIGLERMFLKTMGAALDLDIFIKKTWKSINDSIDSVHLGPLGSLRDVLDKLKGPAGETAMYLLGMLNPITAISQNAAGFGAAISSIEKALHDAYDKGKAWVDRIIGFGTAIVDGIRDKIAGGADKVVTAITGLLKGAATAAKEAIDAHSPSRLFAREVGEPIGEGTAMGIEKSASSVEAAVEAMLVPPKVDAGGAGGSSSVAVTGNTYNFHGVKDAEDALDSFFDSLSDGLGQLANQGAA